MKRCFLVLILSVGMLMLSSMVTNANADENDRFTVSNDGIITDSKTRLEWVPAPEQKMDWAKVQAYVQNLSLGGGGWRLPKRSELRSLYISSMEGNSDPVFNIRSKKVWTSETNEANGFAENVWYLDQRERTCRNLRL